MAPCVKENPKEGALYCAFKKWIAYPLIHGYGWWNIPHLAHGIDISHLAHLLSGANST